MGTPEFALASLARLIEDGHEIGAVFTQPDKPSGRGVKVQPPPVKTFALEHNLAVHQPARIKMNEDVRAVFTGLAPDACVVAAYGKILPEWMLAIPRLGCINVHASLLPKYRGAAPVNWAIARGESETGVTIMRMEAGLDTGPMFAKRATAIGPEEAAPELLARLAGLGADLLSETLPRIADGSLTPEAQDDSRATFAPILKREDGLIDWQSPAREIVNRVRAFQPWPGTYTIFRGGKLILWRAREAEGGSPVIAPATIIGTDKAGFTVACGDGSALYVEELQIEGKRRTPARDFLNGTRLSTGDPVAD